MEDVDQKVADSTEDPLHTARAAMAWLINNPLV